MSRQQGRAAAYVLLFGAAAFVIFLGFNGWYLGGTPIPAQYLGYFLVVFGVAGLLGFNIWAGGPLDPNNDPPPTAPHGDPLQRE